MRIDVDFSHRDLDAELARLHGRMQTPGDALHGLPVIPCALPGMLLHYREMAGECWVYVEDVQRQVLAGCVAFNRAVELDAATRPCMRSPHSRFGAGYQRQGLASAVYGWALHSGLCLLSGPRQSEGAHCLWLSLGRSHPLLLAHLDDRQLGQIQSVNAAAFERLNTRLLLLGSGWNPQRLADCANFSLA